MNIFRKTCLVLIGLVLLAALPAAHAEISQTGTQPHARYQLPASTWWLVIHDQCNDTLHWINPSGKYASIPRPKLPNEAAGTPCSFKPMHISQDGRYLVQIAPLSTGRMGVGFYDLQTAQWITVHEAQAGELVQFGHRYSSDADNRIAISFANQPEAATRAWRVILFDIVSGNLLYELRSDGPEIASFVGGEFLATAATVPYTLLVAHDEATATDQIHIRFDNLDPAVEPFGAVVWFPQGAPGVEQTLISGPYRAQDLDILPDGHAIFAYNEPSYPAGPPVGETLIPITTNTIGLLMPDTLGGTADPQAFFADGTSTVYGPQWAADGRVALFRRADTTATRLHWIKMGAAVLIPLEQEIAQVLGVPTGLVYSTADGIYYLGENDTSPTGPVFSDPILSGGAAFVWATPFGNPPLALDSLGSSTLPIATPSGPTVIIVTATPDNSTCRAASADGASVNVRTGPGTNYPTLGQMGGTSELNVLGYNGQWYVVNFQGSQGWIAGWVTTLKGNCTTLTVVVAPPTPVPTAPPAGAVIEFWADRTSISPGECVNVNWRVENIREVYFEGEGVVGAGARSVCPGATTTYTLTVIMSDGSTQTRTVTITLGGGGQPDLYVSEFSLNPATPVQGQAVNVRVGVYNQGNAAVSGTSFHIEWWPGENYSSPACAWDLDSMAAHGGRILTCTYAGYPSWYGTINTKVVVDSYNSVAESNEGNNTYLQAISVSSP